MDNRNKLFLPSNDKPKSSEDAKSIKLRHELDLRQHYIKVSIAGWLKEDPDSRISTLEKALSDSFSSNSPSYASLPPIFSALFSDPKKYLGKSDVDDPAKTIRTLAEQATKTAINEYMITHPEYEEKLVSDKKNNEENEKLAKLALNAALASNTGNIESIFSDLSDDKIQRLLQTLHNINQSRQDNTIIPSQPELHSPRSPKVK